MNSKSLASLVLLSSFLTTLPAWAGYTFNDGVLTVDGDVDLAGAPLELTGITSIAGSGKFTNSGAVADLTLGIDKDVALSTVTIEGNIRLVKTGSKTLTLPSSSKYSGGTAVYAGVLNINTSSKKFSTTFQPFGTGSAIDIYGGTVEGKAFTNWKPYYVMNLRGGTFKNVAQADSATAFDAPLNVFSDDSSFVVGKGSDGKGKVYGIASDIDLRGNTLSVELTNTLRFNPASVTAGSIVVTGKDKSFQLEKNVDAANVDLTMGATLAFNGNSLDVKNFELTSTGAISGEGTLRVHGTYAPVAADGYYPVMMDGSTLDLSGFSDVAVPTAANFDSGTVTIALGNRALESNQQIVSWTAKPDVAFVFTGTKVDAGKFAISDSGIVYDAKSDVVASATWTGAGAAGNWMDPANWSCKNAAGDEITNPVLTEDLTVTFTGDVSSIAFNNFPFAGVYFNGATLTKGTDWTGFDLNLMTDASVLDLKGQVLTVSAGTGESMTAATITSTVEGGGGLTFVVGEGETYTNSSLNLSGNLKLVKDGAGTFVATKPSQEYVGVTEIGGGIVKCGCVNMSGKTPFGASKTIDLVEGGILDPMGSYNWTGHTINMKGGLISNSVKATGLATGTGTPKDFSPTGGNTNPGQQFNPAIILAAESIIASSEDFNFQGAVTANDYRLVLSIAAGHYILWNPSSAGNASIVVTGGGILGVWCKNPVAQANTALTVEDGTLALSKHDSYGSGNLSVCDYLSSTETTVNLGGADLFVSGTFTPASDYFYGCTMQNGSTIDLGSKTETWNVKSSSTGYNTVKFAADATVTLKLGDREVTPGDLIVAWEKRPVDVTFAFAGANVDSEIPVVWADEGLRYGYAEEPQIVWTNAKGNGDLTDSGNWEGGVVPTDIKATFTGDVSSINIPAGKAFTAEKIWFREATLSADADFSWLDINKVANDSILDLCGHDLTLSCVDGGCTNAGTVTDTSAEGMGGTVTFVVPEGVTYTNSNFNFTGSLNFVKDGKGVLVAEKYPQVYTGTTVVNAGGVRCAEKANMNATDKQSPFGSQCTITLNEDTFLDPAGSANWGFHTVNMNGGIISNTVERMDVGAQYSSTTFNNPFNPTINLMVDSLFVSTKTFTFKGTVKGDGYTLTVKIPDVRWASSKSDAVTIEFVGTGRVRSLKHFQTNEPKVTLIMNGAKFDAGGAWAVSNYVAQSASAFADVRSAEDAKLYVTGTFTPVADDFFGCTMQNGSVIDLSQKTDTWSIVRPNVTTARAVDYVHFAENATVTIDFGDRSISSRKPILSWTEATHPADGVTFKLTDAALANHYVIDVRDDGVYAKRKGMLLLLK